jgi:hypothetical protein
MRTDGRTDFATYVNALEKTVNIALTAVGTVHIGKSMKYPSYPASQSHILCGIILILSGSTILFHIIS